jgi:HAMP domain-containing protein
MAQPPANAANINAALAKFFQNGRGEAGLEVGTDPGLPLNHRIKIPHSMKRRWAFRQIAYENIAYPATATFQELVDDHDFIVGDGDARDIVCLEGKYYITDALGAGRQMHGEPFDLAPLGTADAHMSVAQRNHAGKAVCDIVFEAATLEQIAQFVEVNTPGATDANIPQAHISWVHAARYWGTVAGWVAVYKNDEWEAVANPANITQESWNIAVAVAGMGPEAFTACAARGASWRKTNHCTGGEMAQGLPRRWLDKNGFWGTGNDENQTRALHRSATASFYFATHAIANHAILANLAPADPGHWSRTYADYGYIMKWTPGESVSLRIAGMTQVSGAAIVADSVEVMRMVIKERLSPLVNARDSLDALMAAYETARQGGIAVHSGARWFLDGHPRGKAPENFSQKSAAHFALASELAVIATTYYQRTTIGKSMALRNAADQCSDELAKSTWTSLAANRQALAATEVIKAVARIKGAASVGAVKNIVSNSETAIRMAVGAYNNALRADAAAVGIAGALDLEADRIVTNAKDAAQAEGAALLA